MSEHFQTLQVKRLSDDIAVATLNRPERLNAMTDRMFTELEELAAAADGDELLRVLILTGAGRAFCAGYDLNDADALPSLGAIGMLDQQERAARAVHAVRSVRVPVIAAVNGPAAGGGLSIALAADIRLASPSARFSAAFVRIGLSAGDLGVSWLLPRLIGPALAAEIAYTGRSVHADEAERIGLVNYVTTDAGLLHDAVAIADQICANSPVAVAFAKRALRASLEISSYAAASRRESDARLPTA